MSDEFQFLELSLPATDVRRSLEWYRGLGFIEHSTNDVRSHHYAVIGDGDFCIGLHGDNLAAAGLTFIRQNLARHVRDRMGAGEEFDRAVLGIDDFHETLQSGPDGLQATMLEARTFSPGHAEDTRPLAGELHSIVFPCMNVADSLQFWQRYGLIGVESEDRDHAELHAPGLLIELHAVMRQLTLRFRPVDYDAAVATLNPDYELKMFSDGEHKGVELLAPEGTRLQLLQS